MTSQKDDVGTASTSLPALRVGSRVRCVEDGMEGRITWANGVALKIHWDDGEQVTWRRDSLAERPILILDAVDQEEEATVAITSGTDAELTDSAETSALEPETALATDPAPFTAELDTTQPADTVGESIEEHCTAVAAEQTTIMPAETTVVAKEVKLSALDAAAKVLQEADKPMNCQEMIETMAAKGYWSSPGGKTPAATLYSAILRELTTKGDQARFQKTGRGQFGCRAPV